jgi:hypothetical protein
MTSVNDLTSLLEFLQVTSSTGPSSSDVRSQQLTSRYQSHMKDIWQGRNYLRAMLDEAVSMQSDEAFVDCKS